MRVIGFGVALLAAGAAANKDGDVTYSCPKGWEQSGENCTRTNYVKAVTKTEVQYQEVTPITSCPKGYVDAGDHCTREESVAMTTQQVTQQIPTKVCPKGTQQTKDGCTVTKTVTRKVAEQNHKQVNAQRVSKKTEYIAVKKPVSVPAGVECAKGAQGGKGGCTVVSRLSGYELVEAEKTLKVPKDEKVVTEGCADGSKAPCTVRAPQQSVKEVTSEKKGTVPQLEDKTETVALKSQQKVARQVCPQGSQSSKGGCTITLTRQVVKTKSVPKRVAAGLSTKEVPRTLQLSKTELVPSYSCPKGASQQGDKCLVQKTVSAPVVKETPKRVKVARAVKVPKQVKVPKTVAVATESCPPGATQGKGACVLTTTIQVPYTVETPVSTCPASFTEEQGGCVKETKVYVPAEELPAATKGGKKGEAAPVSQVCPAGTQKDSVGLCYKTHFETAAPEVLTAVKVAFKTETVTESVPALVQYSTKTEYETATIEEIKIEYDEETVVESSTELENSTVTEEVPALVTYQAKVSAESVQVTDIVACTGGAGSKDGCGGSEEMTETSFSVETETVTEEVPMVTAWSIEDHTEQQVVAKTVIVQVPSSVTEVKHVVQDDCGGKGGNGCEKEVPASQFVSFKTVYENVVVTDKKVKTTTNNQEDEVQGAPSYRTVYETEQHETAKLIVETVPTTLTETVIKSETEQETEVVEAGTILRSVVETATVCPAGTQESGKGCKKIVTAPKEVSCPKGSTQKHGTCVEKTSTTVTACPPGSTESGKGCEATETIPATAVYSAPVPPAAKKEAPPAAKKTLFRM